MIPFRRPQLSDREWVSSILYPSARQGCEYTFTNIFLWDKQEIARIDDCLVTFAHWDGQSVYVYPVGSGDHKAVLDCLIDDAHERGIPLRLTGLTVREVEELSAFYPGRFRIRSWRNSFDYLYRIEALAGLKGRKYQQKRNHIHQFLARFPDWSVEPIDAENLEQCRRMAEQWYVQHAAQDAYADTHLEQAALRRAMDNREALGMEGLLLRCDGEVVAFTMGNRINADTFDINFEKAFPQVQGAYAVINREFARRLQQEHPELCWLNREEDMGLPGLRQAKLSYHPDAMVEKHRAVLLEEEP